MKEKTAVIVLGNRLNDNGTITIIHEKYMIIINNTNVTKSVVTFK